jgi:pilus assembly protein Flp/PilA
MRMLVADNRGATAIEYGLLAALIVLGMVAGLGELGGGAGGMWNRLSTRFVALLS